jgi:hypothetical protein
MADLDRVDVLRDVDRSGKDFDGKGPPRVRRTADAT